MSDHPRNITNRRKQSITAWTKKGPRSRKDRGEVHLQQNGHHLEVSPPVPALQEAFRTYRYVPDAEGLQWLRREYISLFEPINRFDDPILRTGMGNYLPAKRFLEERGHRLHIELHLPVGLGRLDEVIGTNLTPEAHDILGLIHGLPRCTIGYRQPSVRPGYLVALIARAWRHKGILVIGETVQQLLAIQKILQEYGIESSVNTRGNVPPRNAGVVLSTLKMACAAEAQAAKRAIVIWLSPGILLQDEFAQSVLNECPQARLVGLVPLNARAPRHERDLVCKYFSDAQIDIFQERKRTPAVIVRIVRYSCPAPKNAGRLSDIEARRNLCRRRERVDAVIAAAEEARQAVPNDEGTGPVVVLVDGIDEALMLLRQRPHWALAASRQLALEGLSQEDQTLIRGAGSNSSLESGVLIATADGFRFGLFASVIVRADTWSGLPGGMTEDEFSRTFQRDEITIIDLQPNRGWHRCLRNLSAARRYAYQEAGWDISEATRPAAAA